MEGGVLLTDEFKKFSKDQVMYLHITTRIPERKNDGMLQEKGGGGFPYLAVMDQAGNVIAKVGDRSVKGFQATMDNAGKFLDLKKKAEAGDPVAVIDFAILRQDIGQITFDELDEELEGKKLSESQKKQFEQARINADVADLFMMVRNQRGSPEAMAKIESEFLGMLKEGTYPTGRYQSGFWRFLLGYAKKSQDPVVFGKVVNAYEEMYGSDERNRARLDGLKAELEDLKKASATEEEEEEPCGCGCGCGEEDDGM